MRTIKSVSNVHRQHSYSFVAKKKKERGKKNNAPYAGLQLLSGQPTLVSQLDEMTGEPKKKKSVVKLA